jgi:hypothetical protein
VKRAPLLIAIAFVVLIGSHSARSLTLEANEVGTGVQIIHYWETDWGSYDRDYIDSKKLRILVRDVSRKVAAADVDVYFVAQPMPSGARFIYAHHHELVKMNGLIDAEGAVVAPDIKSRVLNLEALRERYSSGAEHDGWIVIGSYGGQRFGVRASSQTLLDIAQGTNPRLIDSFPKMTAAYAAIAPAPKRAAVPHPRAPIQTPVAAPPRPLVIAPKYLTLIQPVSIQLPPYGSAMLVVGTKLEVISQTRELVKVRYASAEPTIPISATDLAR